MIQRPPHILIAEDDAATAALIAEVVSADGMTATVAHDGARTLEAIRRDQPDLLVLDLMLPVVDGWTILTQLRLQPATRSLPVVIVSALDDEASSWAGWEAGCDYYITKPFGPGHLLDVLNRLLSRARVN